MNIEDLRAYCLSIPGTEECLPFDDVTLVYKVMGKMYALIPLDTESCSISVKCDPEKAIELRERYQAVEEAWHFNKKYWNTLYPNNDMDDSEIKKWILHSIDQVILKLPKKRQEAYRNLKQ
ncbi:MAG TPA: MmcQ/YjbR family DNA-binding protein [Bacteroidales bacterium]|nr:MmcQ/YjbR family DNA-binding protein [Bacteroidales bacterium]